MSLNIEKQDNEIETIAAKDNAQQKADDFIGELMAKKQFKESFYTKIINWLELIDSRLNKEDIQEILEDFEQKLETEIAVIKEISKFSKIEESYIFDIRKLLKSKLEKIGGITEEEKENIDGVLYKAKDKKPIEYNEYKDILKLLEPAFNKVKDKGITDPWVKTIKEFKDEDIATAILTKLKAA